MSRNPNDQAPGGSPGAEDDGFLARWSRRKREANVAPESNVAPPPENTTAQGAPAEPSDAHATEPASPPVSEADLENLSYESDYTKFMQDGVPEVLRRRALRQLWRSDPILANVDGLCDYDDDFTDAALAVKVLQTAHRVGKGYLTDEELDDDLNDDETEHPHGNLSDSDTCEAPEPVSEPVSEPVPTQEPEKEQAAAETRPEQVEQTALETSGPGVVDQPSKPLPDNAKPTGELA